MASTVSKIGFMICLTLLYNATASAQCQGDFQGLIQQCSRYVQKAGPEIKPSNECCNLVRNVDLPCVCEHVTSEAERIISMRKATFVAGFCGKPLAHGTKCGSKKLTIKCYVILHNIIEL